jgi:prepilin-type processing-associated H-X9-DG protein
VDIFRDCPLLAHYPGPELLAIYTAAVGGETIHVGTALVTVPLVRADLPYRETDTAGQVRNCDLLAGAVMADEFWYQHQRSPAPARPGLTTYPVNASWCHQGRFNVLFGDGAVCPVEDDGTVRANTLAPDLTLADDHANYSTYAIAVWRYFEDRR